MYILDFFVIIWNNSEKPLIKFSIINNIKWIKHNIIHFYLQNSWHIFLNLINVFDILSSNAYKKKLVLWYYKIFKLLLKKLMQNLALNFQILDINLKKCIDIYKKWKTKNFNI